MDDEKTDDFDAVSVSGRGMDVGDRKRFITWQGETRDERLRVAALQIANSASGHLGTPDLVRRAEAYLRFLKGEETRPPQS